MMYDLHHHLLETPRWVSIWVSFSETGTADGGSVAHASANEAVLRSVGPTSITIHNDGCQQFWLLVVAGTGGDQPVPP
jgi:hypothetical protein